jgi:hypothetical protein
MIKPLRRYSIAVKESVEFYKQLGLDQTCELGSENLCELRNYVINFIRDHEDSVNGVLPMISTYANNLRGSMEEIRRYSDGLEVYNDNVEDSRGADVHTSPLQGRAPQQFDFKDLNFTNPMTSPDSKN